MYSSDRFVPTTSARHHVVCTISIATLAQNHHFLESHQMLKILLRDQSVLLKREREILSRLLDKNTNNDEGEKRITGKDKEEQLEKQNQEDEGEDGTTIQESVLPRTTNPSNPPGHRDPGNHKPGERDTGERNPGALEPGEHEPGDLDPGKHDPSQWGFEQQSEQHLLAVTGSQVIFRIC